MGKQRSASDVVALIGPRLDTELFDIHPGLVDRIATEDGFSIEHINDLHRLAGGARWKASVADLDTSTCARTLLQWLHVCGLELYSHRALTVAGEENGRVMTRRVLRQLHGTDPVVVIDPKLPRGAALQTGDLTVRHEDPWTNIVEPPGLEARIRIANAKDAAEVARLRTWKSPWLDF